MESELSTLLDFEELVLKEPPIGEGTRNITSQVLFINRFTVGSFGVVFRGNWRGMEVAIKMMKGFGLTSEGREEFIKEKGKIVLHV